MVSCLMFKSLSHFEFIFVYGVRVCSNSLIYICCPAFPIPFAEETLPHCIPSPPLLKIDCRCVGLFLGCLICSIDPCLFLCQKPCCFDYSSFVVLSEVWEGLCLLICSFSSGLLWQ